MIILTDVANKLNELLNNAEDFNQYQFEVETQGFHIDHIYDKTTGKNFIPVFISTMGGTNNPVPDLKQSEYSIPITFYFPVRFKDDFFALNEFLNDTFVGKFITFGTQKARCNVSIASYGEIQQMDFKEFKEWVGDLYKLPIDVMEMWMSMNITLFLTTSGSSFIYGDNVKIKKVTVYNGSTKILEDSSPLIIERADIASLENAPQQLLGETHIKGYPANLGYTKELPLIVKNTSEYRALFDILENSRDIQALKIEITEEFPFETALTTSITYYVSNYSRRTTYGSLLGISLTLAELRV